ncbi:MAG: prephenate dehydrogenase dimerization domain-containing protein, partial [Casimicrobiaceae bacterium]
HLPHVLAHTLVAELAGRHDSAALFAHAGPGFRDFTRIAASSPEMWRDVTLANRHALIAELAAFVDALAKVARALAAGDGDTLEDLFRRSRDARRDWQAGGSVDGE